MNTYKVTYELIYPDCDNDIRYAYVLAKDFTDAENKVDNRYDEVDRTCGVHKYANICAIELLDGDIIV